MTDRPIIFSGPMIRALLAGTKTQTRRVLKPAPGMQAKWLTVETLNRAPSCYLAEVDGRLGAQMQHPKAGANGVDAMSPLTWVPLPYAPGDRLWVREAWKSDRAYDDLAPSEMGGEEPLIYLADSEVQRWGWKPDALSRWGRYRHARFMPRWASRLTLHVTEVRVQRLQEISEADAIREGITPQHKLSQREGGAVLGWGYDGLDGRGKPTARLAFRSLWNSLHGKGTWDANPWTAAITFTVERANIDQVSA